MPHCISVSHEEVEPEKSWTVDITERPGRAQETPLPSATESALENGQPNANIHELPPMGWRDWLRKDMVAFLILGVLVPLPTMITVSGARLMFVGMTGISGICLALPAAVVSFTTGLVIHHVSYTVRVLVNILVGMLGLAVCTLGSSVAGPVFGTVMAGFVYAFGSNLYLAAAAFYDQRTVIMFNIGTGLAAVVGPSLYIGFMEAFNDNWRMSYRITIPFPTIQALIWWFMLSKEGRNAAEKTRMIANARDAARRRPQANSDGAATSVSSSSTAPDCQEGFGDRTRIGMFVKTILPKYVLPLLLCTMGAIFALQGLVPTFLSLNSFKLAPKGDLNYQLNFLTYGTATFLFAMISIVKALPQVWLWAGVSWTVVVIGIIQLFVPFLTYFPVWLIFIFVSGGIVGGSQTNTNYKIADDFRKRGESEDVRAFAMSYGGLGNFAGDVLGGAIAVLVQRMAEMHLPVRS